MGIIIIIYVQEVNREITVSTVSITRVVESNPETFCYKASVFQNGYESIKNTGFCS